MNFRRKRKRMRERAGRMKQIERAIKSIARIARFMTDNQLKPYENMADEYEKLKKEK